MTVLTLRQRIQNVQDDIGPVLKDCTNPFHKSKYANINSVIELLRPLMKQHGLIVLQPLTHINGRPAIKTVLTCDTGETIESEFPISDNPDPQKTGGWITYMRRYSLISLFCLESVDDDAESILRPTNGGGFKPSKSSDGASGAGTRTWKKQYNGGC